MIAIISLFIILVLSITLVRIGAIALELTGISADVAAFQAQSAFSGTGFTTTESESIVTHPVRRKIIRILILVGSAGITSVIATVILTFADFDQTNMLHRGLILLGGLVAIYLFFRSKIIYRMMKKVIVKALSLNPELNFHDYYEMLGIAKGYSVSRLTVKADNWAVGRALKDLNLNKEGTLILSIHRQNSGEQEFIVPNGLTEIQAGDQLTVYGRCSGAKCLFSRPKGEQGDARHEMQIHKSEQSSVQ